MIEYCKYCSGKISLSVDKCFSIYYCDKCDVEYFSTDKVVIDRIINNKRYRLIINSSHTDLMYYGELIKRFNYKLDVDINSVADKIKTILNFG
jgi:3-dehydroquinate dehydratase